MTVMVNPVVREAVESEVHAYAHGAELPLGSFATFMAVYAGAVAGLGVTVRRSGRTLPDRLSWSDMVLMSFAAHKLARLIAKDPVTSPVRAPFTRFAGTSGPAELSEEVRGRGPRKAIGELITCPFCLSQWIATGLAFGMVLMPRPTRFIAAIFTARTGADFLQFVYSKLQT